MLNLTVKLSLTPQLRFLSATSSTSPQALTRLKISKSPFQLATSIQQTPHLTMTSCINQLCHNTFSNGRAFDTKLSTSFLSTKLDNSMASRYYAEGGEKKAQPVPRSKGTIDVLQYDTHGGKIERVLPKLDLSTELNIPGRDLRVVDSTQNVTTIVVKDNAIIFNIEHVRGIIQADRFIVFDSKNPIIRNLLIAVEGELKKTSAPTADDKHLALIYDPTNVEPFEFQVLEQVLEFICDGLRDDYASLRPKIETIMHQPFTKKLAESLDLLYLYGEDLDQLYARVAQVSNALSTVLDSDEDLAAMYLTVRMKTGYPRRKDQHQEVELLLESYLSRVQTIASTLLQLKKRVEKTEQHIRVSFASQRNNIMKLNLLFTMVTVSLTMGSFGAGLFGMNLRTGIELDPQAFYIAASTFTLTIPTVFGIIYIILKRNRTL